MKNYLKKKLLELLRSDKKIIIFSFAASLFAIAGAYISEIFFHLKPCKLCYYQRMPFFLLIFLSFLVFIFIKFSKKKLAKNLIKKIDLSFLLLFFANFLLASYHVGVEKKIFSGPTSCSSNSISNIDNIVDLEKFLNSAAIINCGEPAFVFLNISFAGWNAVYCLFCCLIITFLYLFKKNSLIKAIQ